VYLSFLLCPLSVFPSLSFFTKSTERSSH
jgi:hypothetical protein